MEHRKDKFWAGLPTDHLDFLGYNVGRAAREAIQYPVAREDEESKQGCACTMCQLFPARAA